MAQPGDQIYIHCSGQGGRVETIYPDLKGATGFDSALVPMDVASSGYLRDVEFESLIEEILEKEADVTAVLDFCHASSMIGTNRATTDLFQHYILLAACRPTEYCYEYAVNGGTDRYGALSYWFIDTLFTLGTNITYQQLYNRIFAKIHSKFPQQTPLLYGDGSRIFFRRDYRSTDAAAAVMKVTDQQITLSAGLAQGLSTGTRFAIYPLNTTTFSDKQKQLATVEITGVNASSASAKVLTAEAGGMEVRGQIEQGAPAVMISAPVDLVRRVRLFDQKQAGEAEHDLPPALVDRQKAALDAVRQALAGNGWVVEAQTETQEAYYQVAIGRTGYYEICIGLPIKNLLPSLPIDDPTSAAQVVNRLVHLAKYQAVQELDNVNSGLTDALEFEALDENKQPFSDVNNLVMKQGEVFYLRIKNASHSVLNVVVLDLEPTWAISHILLRGIDTIFYQVAPNEIVDTRLLLGVPQGQWYENCKETLKLFAAYDPIDFRWLELPPLADLPRGRLGDRQTANLQNSVTQQGALFEQSRITHRAATMALDPRAEWATKQMLIRIQL